MSAFKNLKTDDSISADKDTLGGGSKFGAWESGAYDTVIELAYVDESKGGAMSVNFVFKTQDGKELRQNIYVTSGKEKGQLNYYVDKEGTKKYLPGFNQVNDICLLANGVTLSDMETEKTTVACTNCNIIQPLRWKKPYCDSCGRPLKKSEQLNAKIGSQYALDFSAGRGDPKKSSVV